GFLAGAENRADIRQLHEHHIAERDLRVVGDADRDGAVLFHAGPFVAARVFQFGRVMAHGDMLKRSGKGMPGILPADIGKTSRGVWSFALMRWVWLGMVFLRPCHLARISPCRPQSKRFANCLISCLMTAPWKTFTTISTCWKKFAAARIGP